MVNFTWYEGRNQNSSIPGNYHQTWSQIYPMTFAVPCIVEVLMYRVALWISIRTNDWATERAIIASNGVFN